MSREIHPTCGSWSINPIFCVQRQWRELKITIVSEFHLTWSRILDRKDVRVWNACAGRGQTCTTFHMKSKHHSQCRGWDIHLALGILCYSMTEESCVRARCKYYIDPPWPNRRGGQILSQNTQTGQYLENKKYYDWRKTLSKEALLIDERMDFPYLMSVVFNVFRKKGFVRH